MDIKERKEKIIELSNNGLSYVNIGKIFNISKQRAHQIISSYRNINRRVLKAKMVKIIKDYYSNRCVICGSGASNLVIHHIDENPSNNSMINLVLLCRSCHGDVHGNKIKTIHKKDNNMTIKQLTKKAGQASVKKRFKGKTKKEISAIMSAVRKGVAKHD